MANRQYIGARYVPKFHDGSSGTDWTANTQYEALTIVTRNGNSYTSKKPVPASVGAPESNPDYWASTGIFNAQLQTVSDNVDAVANDLQTFVEENSAAFSAYTGKILCVAGDSIAKGRYVLPDEAFPAVAAAAMGMTCKNFAVNSGGYTRSGAMQVLTQINAAIADNSFDNEDVGIFLLSAGVNDINDAPNATTYAQAVRTAIATVKNNFPNARIIVTDYTQGNAGLVVNADVGSAYIVYNNIKSVCLLLGVECIDNAFAWGLSHASWFTSTGPSPHGDAVNADVLHPNVAGNQYYAYYLLQYIAGNKFLPYFAPNTITAAELAAHTGQVCGCRVINGNTAMYGYYDVTPPATPSNEITATLPQFMAGDSRAPYFVTAYVVETGAPRVLIPLFARVYTTAGSGQTQPTVTMRLQAPSGGWLATHIIYIPYQTREIGT